MVKRGRSLKEKRLKICGRIKIFKKERFGTNINLQGISYALGIFYPKDPDLFKSSDSKPSMDFS